MSQFEIEEANRLKHWEDTLADRAYGERYLRVHEQYSQIAVLKKSRPDILDRIDREYRRVGGFIPYQYGYVYAIKACGSKYYKFGKSVNPDQRLLQIAPKMPFEIRFVRAWRTNFMDMAEKWLHEHFSKHRANGEWFELEERDAAEIFVSLSFEYDEQIRNVYGSYFFDNVVKDMGFTRTLVEDFYEFTDGTLDFGSWGGSSWSIAWIDRIFSQLSEQELPVPDDLKTHYNGVIDDYRKCLRSAIGRDGGVAA